MKVLIINGSPRTGGNTSVALEEMRKIFEKEGIETEMFAVGGKDIRGCIARGRCGELENAFLTMPSMTLRRSSRRRTESSLRVRFIMLPRMRRLSLCLTDFFTALILIKR